MSVRVSDNHCCSELCCLSAVVTSLGCWGPGGVGEVESIGLGHF